MIAVNNFRNGRSRGGFWRGGGRRQYPQWISEARQRCQKPPRPCPGAACRALRCCSLLTYPCGYARRSRRALSGTAQPPFLESTYVNHSDIRVHPGPSVVDSCSKTGFFRASVNKTYLTFLYLTAVSANKIKGFVREKNPFPEAVKNPAFLLKWPHAGNVPRQLESRGETYFTTKSTES